MTTRRYAPIGHEHTADDIDSGAAADGYVLTADGAGGSAFEAASGVPTTITVANEATDTTCFPLFVTAATGDLAPKTNAGLTFNSNTQSVDIDGRLMVNGAATGTTGALTLSNTLPAIYIEETDAATNEKLWRIIDSGGDFFVQTLEDDGSNAVTAIRCTRTGTAIDEVELNATAMDINGTMDVSGAATFPTSITTPSLVVRDSGATDFDTVTHTGVDIRHTHTNTRMHRFLGQTGGVMIDSDGGGGAVYIAEMAAAGADFASFGQFWVKDDVPNIPMFTDDAGTDYNLITSTSPTLNGSLVYSKGWVTALDISEVTDVLALTTDLTGVAAGDIYDVEITGLLLNNSGGNRVTTWTLDFDGLFDVEFNQTLGFSSTQWLPLTIKARFVVVSSSLSYCTWNCYTAAGIQTAGTDVAMGTSSQAHSWNTSTTDATGTVTVTLHFRSANAAATQNWTQLSATIRKSQVV